MAKNIPAIRMVETPSEILDMFDDGVEGDLTIEEQIKIFQEAFADFPPEKMPEMVCLVPEGYVSQHK